MDFSDIILLTVPYMTFAAVIFSVSYGASSLWAFFKSMADPGYSNE